MYLKRYFILLIFFANILHSTAKPVDISEASIFISKDIKAKVQNSSVKILQEEVSKRSGFTWQKIDKWKDSRTYTIALALSSTKKLDGRTPPVNSDQNAPEFRAEGYKIKMIDEVIWIIGADSRAVIFGIGELLRSVKLEKGQVMIDADLNIASAPQYSLRGHQLGYRNTANSYDAWSVEQYDQYIRELVLFGTNAIENIPPLGNGQSPHFKVSREEMNVEMSKICDDYDIEYWVWTPATVDLTDDDLRQKQLELHDANYQQVPRLDNVFFPGGDPGHNHPREVMPFLRDLHARLTKYHPDAGIWISLQGFSQEQIDYFYQYLDQHKPDWLRGLVSGPSSPSISQTRYRLPEQYKHRHYPDITHNVRCDYPAQNFDQAFALTIGREGINPQPVYYAKIHGKYAPFTDGFMSYSDGCHDDVNKVIWSQRGWDPDKSVLDILKEYARFFFSPQVEESAAEGILGLEKNGELYQKIAFCYQKMGNYEKALDGYKKAELYELNRLWNLKKIALCYRNLKQPDKALEYYRMAEKLDTENLNIQLSIGHCLLELEQFDEALKSYFKVEYLSPGNKKVWRPIGWCSFVSGKKEQAEKYFQKLIDDEPSKHDFMNMGHVQWSLGNRKAALDFYKKSIKQTDFAEKEFLEVFEEDLSQLLKQGVNKDDVPIMLDQLRYFLEE